MQIIPHPIDSYISTQHGTAYPVNNLVTMTGGKSAASVKRLAHLSVPMGLVYEHSPKIRGMDIPDAKCAIDDSVFEYLLSGVEKNKPTKKLAAKTRRPKVRVKTRKLMIKQK